MNIKQKILKFLIENKERTFSIYGLSKALKIDYKLLYINIKKLEKERSIEVKDLKNQKRCSFNDIFNEDVFIVENERRNYILKKKEFRAIYDYLKDINKQFIVLLFGSHVKGTATKHSDIDLLLISPEEDVKKIEEKLSILPFKIHLTPISYESFINMLKSKEFTVVSEALKKNIILFGIDDYYRLIQNAK
nr:nucleotidyltransferase domain-containing protein [Candidatus Woesearchaeota archaeon]